MDFSNELFRCSASSLLMTESKTGKGLSETTMTYLKQYYVTKKYGRETDINSKYISKGLAVEEDSITLYSRVKKRFFKKNEERISNLYISGLPDLYEGPDIRHATFVPDIKSSWDIFTFFKNDPTKIQKAYYWQVQGYMALTGARKGSVVYCLIDTPEVLISDEKRRLMWKMGVATEESPLYIEACNEIDKNMHYNDIPLDQRVIEHQIEYCEEDIIKLYRRINECREYLNRLEADFMRNRPNIESEYLKAKP